MSLQNEFFAIRLNDREMLEAIQRAVTDVAGENAQLSYESELIGSRKSGDIASLDAIKAIAEKETFALRRIKITFGQQHLQVERTQHHEKHELLSDGDKVTVVHHQDAGVMQHVNLVAAARKHLTTADRAERLPDNVNSIDDAIRERIAILSRLERLAETFFQKSAEHVTKAEQHLADNYASQEQKLSERRDTLEREHIARMDALGEREVDLAKKLAEVDLRDPRIVRRKLREELLGQLGKREEKFELTWGTTVKFCIVAGAYLLLVAAVVLAMLFAGNWRNEEQGDIRLALLLRESALFLGIALIGWFFVRSVYRWFRDHADEELYARRLELDVNRASWVYEMAVEWQYEKQGPIPEFLIDRLSRNVFPERSETAGAATPIDAVSSALRRDGSLQIRHGDKEIILRQSRRRRHRK